VSFKEFVQDLSHDDLKQIHFHYAIQSMIEDCIDQFVEDGLVDTRYIEDLMEGYVDTSELSAELLAAIIANQSSDIIAQCYVPDLALMITDEYSDFLIKLNEALHD
jgi:hypothetical protein